VPEECCEDGGLDAFDDDRRNAFMIPTAGDVGVDVVASISEWMRRHSLASGRWVQIERAAFLAELRARQATQFLIDQRQKGIECLGIATLPLL